MASKKPRNPEKTGNLNPVEQEKFNPKSAQRLVPAPRKKVALPKKKKGEERGFKTKRSNSQTPNLANCGAASRWS